MTEQTTKLLNKTFLLATILVVGILIFFVGQMAYQVRILDQQNTNQIMVSGQGKVYAKPDVALVSLGVTAQATTVADVTKNGTDKMNAVITVIKNLKVDEKDIQTTNYSLIPVYENYSTPVTISMMYPTGPGGGSVSSSINRTGTTVIGYRLEQNVQVKIRDFTKIGDILSQATLKGANLVGDLQFTIDNPEKYKEQARAEAIKKAKASAQNLAKESGIGLGKIINVYENYSPYPVTYNSMAKGLGGASDTASIPVIQPGQQEIDVTINLTYQVR